MNRMGLRRLVPVLAPLAVLAAGCTPPGRPDPAQRPVPANQVVRFDVLYRQNCAGCHGADGKLGPAPPLADPLFRGLVSEQELTAVLTDGRPGTLMPAFAQENGGTLTPTQIQVLVQEIKGTGVAPQWGVPAQPPANAPSYREPAASSGKGNREKGAQVFARACAVCHGEDGAGFQRAGATVNAINDRVFLALISNQALRRYVITGRPDLGMPSYAGARPGAPHFTPLTEAEVTDLVALLASWRGEQHGNRR